MLSNTERRLRHGFNRLADHYARSAVLTREVESRLLDHLEGVRLDPRHILDLGCGPGAGSAALLQRFPQAQCWAIDSAERMLTAGRRQNPGCSAQRLCADAANLPLPAACADLLYSNLLLAWCTDSGRVLREWRRLGATGSLLLFSTLGPDSLQEIRSIQVAQGQLGANPFPDMHVLGDALLTAGFVDPVMDCERLTVTYSDSRALIHELRQLGAAILPTRPLRPGLAGRGRWRQFHESYPKTAGESRCALTLELVYGQAWVPSGTAAAASQPRGPGTSPLRRWR